MTSEAIAERDDKPAMVDRHLNIKAERLHLRLRADDQEVSESGNYCIDNAF